MGIKNGIDWFLSYFFFFFFLSLHCFLIAKLTGVQFVRKNTEFPKASVESGYKRLTLKTKTFTILTYKTAIPKIVIFKPRILCDLDRQPIRASEIRHIKEIFIYSSCENFKKKRRKIDWVVSEPPQ